MSGPEQHPYQYVVLRCVPRVDREEFLNVGVVLYCEESRFLDAAWSVDEARLQAAFPALDLGALCRALEYVEGVCAGDERAGAAGGHAPGTRFGFLKAPRSTVVQPGPVHGGVAADPAAALRRLRDRLVGPERPQEPGSQTGTSSTAPTA
ncbi:DUF3037 domain-containing protein [Nocardioides zeae]|uniref:DUF3037 domain-containing protein n=1 Tax=Nocardioides imazamoxiresistens TaxID=3231893 RepID=A0ABU3PTP7_9ACTN|nr:DUF3037 domain-containing protein [Nocardioides zeae]MDT9592571.1 DUF3037 domain-containing protein [Nocardioides zeae]